MKWKVQLSDISFGKEEYVNIQKVLKSKWLSMGQEVKKFENNFLNIAIKSKNYHAIACSSCTAALHLSMMAIGVKPGDEIIIPSISFIASANIIKLMGATPKIADITSYENLNIDPKSIEKLISKKTKAIVVMHYGGFPCDMKKIQKICKINNIFLIEDAAHAPGASIGKKSIGTFGEISCFSFFANKNITTAEGGMIITSDRHLANKISSLRSHGMTSMSIDRHKGRSTTYDIIDVGLNYRMDEIRAAIGNIQLKKLAYFNFKRKRLFERYLLKLPSNIIVPFSSLKKTINSSYHLIEIILPDYIKRNQFAKYLNDHGIQSSIHYLGYDNFSKHLDLKNIMNNKTKMIINRILTLPLHPMMKFSDVDYVCVIIKKFFNE